MLPFSITFYILLLYVLWQFFWIAQNNLRKSGICVHTLGRLALHGVLFHHPHNTVATVAPKNQKSHYSFITFNLASLIVIKPITNEPRFSLECPDQMKCNWIQIQTEKESCWIQQNVHNCLLCIKTQNTVLKGTSNQHRCDHTWIYPSLWVYHTPAKEMLRSR